MYLIIFDVDGTLAEFHPADVHEWVLGPAKQWDPFFAHMANAPVIEPVARLVKLLKAQGQHIVICSGRPDSHREHTQAWLTRHDIPFDAMYLRPEGDDHVDDEEVKAADGLVHGVPPVLRTIASSSRVLPGIAAGIPKNSSWLEIPIIIIVSGVSAVRYVNGKLSGVQAVTAAPAKL